MARISNPSIAFTRLPALKPLEDGVDDSRTHRGKDAGSVRGPFPTPFQRDKSEPRRRRRPGKGSASDCPSVVNKP
ncbi:hypothetical protein SKAU_G00096380 [Synaphobranchus kaupii]|uniref:Uncharacterized protein n=1 Tax=Synaphobranchus kaupii TaxID=118154 RepID=A0A9Q1FYL2_SYNKA|nr:hypothetical protein SKAU_G00096380 [Synaphobranchus kaupii]